MRTAVAVVILVGVLLLINDSEFVGLHPSACPGSQREGSTAIAATDARWGSELLVSVAAASEGDGTAARETAKL